MSHAAMRHSLDPVIVTGSEAKLTADPPGQVKVHPLRDIRLPAETRVEEDRNENAPGAAPLVSKTDPSTIQLLFCTTRIGVMNNASA